MRSFWWMMAAVLLLGMAAWGQELPKDEPKNGTVTGILVAKGEAWVEVKADGEKEAVRYIPYWRGGAPKDGGGPDKETVATIKKIAVSNLVTVQWELQENHRRIVKIEVVAPEKKTGDVTGVITAKGDTWIDVKPKDSPAERYMARWIGGMPKDGGGMDKAMVEQLKALKVGDTVKITWSYDERKRLDTLAKVETK